ncbi:MAG: hypothetical protein R3Y24_15280 [Eubacteriales bacterium]
MIERSDKGENKCSSTVSVVSQLPASELTRFNYVHCPICGRFLMKCNGNCEIEIKCTKCDGNIAVGVKNGMVMVSENRMAKVSVRKEEKVKRQNLGQDQLVAKYQ